MEIVEISALIQRVEALEKRMELLLSECAHLQVRVGRLEKERSKAGMAFDAPNSGDNHA